MADLRQISLNALMEIDEGKDMGAVNTALLTKYAYLDRSERAFIGRLLKGTIEDRIKLDHILSFFSKTPVKKMRPLIRNLLRMSVYQLYEMDSVPESAAVNEAVKLAKKNGFKQLSGFVNGVLRSAARGKGDVIFPGKEDPLSYINICCSLPLWMGEMFIKEYGAENAIKMAEYRGTEKGLSLNVNTLRTDPDSLMAELLKEGLTVEKGSFFDRELRVKGVNRIKDMSSFERGGFFIQDASSMFVCEHAGIRGGDKVLDLCGAPGGKSIHAATLCGNTGKVLCFDKDSQKMERIKENIERMGMEHIISYGVNDALIKRDDLNSAFDVVLADVPCSGLGVIGRKPDIKYNVTENDIEELVPIQKRILQNAGAYVRPGGRLCYSTCTVAREENKGNTEAFLRDNDDFEIIYEKQLLQGVDDCDGFYICVFRKK